MRVIVKTYRTEEDFTKDIPRESENYVTINEALITTKKRVAKARLEDEDVGFKIFDRAGKLRYKLPHFN